VAGPTASTPRKPISSACGRLGLNGPSFKASADAVHDEAAHRTFDE
jgi:hypothetical protein